RNLSLQVFTQKFHQKVIHTPASDVPERDIWMPFLGIPARRGDRRPHPPNFPVCVRFPKSLIGWVLQTLSRVAILNPSVYATSRTFPPDSFCGYRRRLGLFNVRDIC